MEPKNLSSFFNFFNLKSDNTPGSFDRPQKKEAPSSSPEKDFFQLKNFNINAAQLGVYSPEEIRKKGIEALQLKDFSPITQGDPLRGAYRSRFIYLEDGTTPQSSGGNLGGRFVISTEYAVRGVPSRASQNSSEGQFPVNGQFFFQGAFPNKVDFSNSQVLNGQYAVSNTDIVNQSFEISGVVNANGPVNREGPFLITQSELRNGRFQIRVQNIDQAFLQVSGQNAQRGGIETQQGQILVNGINSVQGKVRLLNQFTQNATLLIEGSYNDAGEYTVNGTVLQNGVNSVTTRYSLGGIQGSSTGFIEGRYTSGGQFLVSTSQESISSSPLDSPTKSTRQILDEIFKAYTRPEPGRILKLSA